MSTLILGGGIGGLSVCHYLLKKFPKHPVKVVESASRVGGWIRSVAVNNGVIFEQGPRTVRPRGEAGINTLELIEELSLQHDLVPISFSSPAAQNRMVYAKEQLYSLPNSLSGLFEKQNLFSKPLIRFLLNDFTAAKKQTEDESVYDFVNRRFGSEVADYLISPLICGICAGNAKEISVNFLMKQLFEYEQKYGNIYKGLLRSVVQPKQKTGLLSNLAQKAIKERWSVYSFKNGLETLTEKLSNSVIKANGEIHLNTQCNKVKLYQDKVTLYFNNAEEFNSSRLISSIPAQNLAHLIEHQHPELSNMLMCIDSVDVGVVNLHYKENVVEKPGFGFLVAPKEKLPILGVIYDSCCFPKDDNSTVLTVMMGGHWFEDYFGKTPQEDQLLKTALIQLEKILNIRIEPAQYSVNILRKCIPQYKIGHNKNINNILNYIRTKNLPLYLCGASYHGVGINDVILSAKNVVNTMKDI